jgi:pantoate--beta-alanine ligase
MPMQIITQASGLHAFIAELRRSGRRIGFVPTMGNLHAGHHSLVALAREHADVVVASVFVNPTQFGPNEDFARYPRTPDADAAGLAAQGCDALFLPAVEDLYPYGAERTVRVSVPELPDVLEGVLRPGHFDGVATVVAKLFNLVQPDIAVFGQKDYQQLLVIRRMARDLGYPIEIVGAPIVREANGLAMSSRNQYLGVEQRERAGVIHATLQWMRTRIVEPGQGVATIEAQARERLAQAGLVADYAAIRRADDLGEPTVARRDGLIALIAARLGPTQLIDNMLFDV